MRKILIIALTLIVGAGALFAVDNDQIILKLEHGESTVPKWLLAEATLDDFDSKLDQEDDYFSEDEKTLTLYPSLKTNSTNKIVVTVSGNPLASGSVSTKIGLSASGENSDGGTAVIWDETSAADKITWTESAAGTANRVISHKLEITMDADDYAAAAADNGYQATLTMEISSST